jgi:hypothetical protein
MIGADIVYRCTGDEIDSKDFAKTFPKGRGEEWCNAYEDTFESGFDIGDVGVELRSSYDWKGVCCNEVRVVGNDLGRVDWVRAQIQRRFPKLEEVAKEDPGHAVFADDGKALVF